MHKIMNDSICRNEMLAQILNNKSKVVGIKNSIGLHHLSKMLVSI